MIAPSHRRPVGAAGGVPRLGVLIAAAVLASAAAPAFAQKPPIDLNDVAIQQRQGAAVPLDLEFHDETGATVRLGRYFGEKPVLLNLVYFDCPMLCNMTQEGLIRSLKQLSLDVGKEFNVLTVSFSPQDSIKYAAARRKATLARYERPGAEAGWHYLTGAEPQIRRLTEAVGFRYAWDAKSARYAHAAAIIALTPQGRVSRYLSGVEYSPRDVRLALVESASDRIGTPTDQVMLLCYQYDPTTGRYGLAIMSALRVAGTLTVLAMAGAFAALLRRERRAAAPKAAETPDPLDPGRERGDG
jgi:protein SCO1/2